MSTTHADPTTGIEPAPAEPKAGGKIICNACPVLCNISEGRSGACDRYANVQGVLTRLDPLVLTARTLDEKGELVAFGGKPWDETLAAVWSRHPATANRPAHVWQRRLSGVPVSASYVMAAGTMGGPYDGAAFNPARAFGPDFARGDLSTYWVYPLGSFLGVIVAVVTARFLRGPAKAQEANAAMGNPLGQDE